MMLPLGVRGRWRLNAEGAAVEIGLMLLHLSKAVLAAEITLRIPVPSRR